MRVKSVRPIQGFVVRLEFTDGSYRFVDLDRYLAGPIFAHIRADEEFFRAVSVDDGAIAWPNGADIDPDVLYYGIDPGGPMPAEWQSSSRPE